MLEIGKYYKHSEEGFGINIVFGYTSCFSGYVFLVETTSEDGCFCMFAELDVLNPCNFVEITREEFIGLHNE